MPIQTWDKSVYSNEFRFNAEPNGHPNTRPGIKVGYLRSIAKKENDLRAKKLMRVFNWSPDTHIVIVGAGYGWTAEALRDKYDITNILATDTSTYIQDTFSTTDADEVSEAIQAVGLDPTTGEGLGHFNRLVSEKRSNIMVYDEDLLTEGSRRRILKELGHIDVILTELVMSTLHDDEARTLSENLNKTTGNPTIIHLDVSLSVPERTDYNYKLIEGWKSLIPNDLWVDASTYRIV